jgi:hypothetical protein
MFAWEQSLKHAQPLVCACHFFNAEDSFTPEEQAKQVTSCIVAHNTAQQNSSSALHCLLLLCTCYGTLSYRINSRGVAAQAPPEVEGRLVAASVLHVANPQVAPEALHALLGVLQRVTM